MLCLLGGLLLPLILCVLGLEISQRYGKCLEDSMNLNTTTLQLLLPPSIMGQDDRVIPIMGL